jgi:hypothetical protein
LHCTLPDGGVIKQETSMAACNPDASAPPPSDAGAEAGDGGASDDGGGDDGGPNNPYGATHFGSEGDDDDCKYHVAWTATPIRESVDVTFTVVAKNRVDGSPLHGSPIRLEVFLNDTHPAPNTHQTSSEDPSTPGTYTVGPIHFDASGQWTVRFHFHEECADLLDNSPHGHTAFYVQVP